MRTNRVVITGLGVISSIGIGKDEFWKNLIAGKSGLKPITLFDTSRLKAKLAGEITDFDAKEFLGDKGLRNLDRSTKLITSAAKLALDDAHIEISEENTDDIGVCVGTTLGSVASISEFDKDAIRGGLHAANPALFPNTVINSPASHVSIKFGIKGLNSTISTGFSASLDAINYAVSCIQSKKAKIILTGAVEELCEHTFLAFYKTGFLAGLNNGSLEISCPFDKRRNGIVFAEGSCVLALEDYEHALARKANIYAEILGFGMSFNPYRINKYYPKGTGLKNAMRFALEEAKINPEDIDYISSSANSTIEADKIETDSIKEVFGPKAFDISISSIKSMIGETFSASGAFQAASSIYALNSGVVPPTINYQGKDTDCDLDYTVNSAKNKNIRHALINTFGPSGCNSCLVLGKGG